MKRSGNPKIKLLAATSMVIFSLAAAFSGAYAWFDSNSKVAQEADTMKVEVVRNFQSITIYRADSASVLGYTFNQTPVQTITSTGSGGSSQFVYKDADDNELTGDSVVVDMNPDITEDKMTYPDPYSPLNPYHPLMMVIEYSEAINAADPDASITIKATTNAKFLAPYKDAATGRVMQAQTIAADDNPLSSFIHTYAKGYAEDTDIPFSYTAADLSEGNSMQHCSFATFSDNVATFNDSPKFYVNNENTIKRVAIIFDYYQDAVEFVYTANLGNKILDAKIGATCDWTLII